MKKKKGIKLKVKTKDSFHMSAVVKTGLSTFLNYIYISLCHATPSSILRSLIMLLSRPACSFISFDNS